MIAARQHALPPDVEARHQIGVRLHAARKVARQHGRAQSPKLRQQIGEALKAAREAAGMSRETVARRLGVSRVMVFYMESGSKRVPLERIDDVANVYGLTPGQLERPPVVTRTEEEAEFLAAFRHMREDERAALLALVRS